jgi:hypothetical protein
VVKVIALQISRLTKLAGQTKKGVRGVKGWGENPNKVPNPVRVKQRQTQRDKRTENNP